MKKKNREREREEEKIQSLDRNGTEIRCPPVLRPRWKNRQAARQTRSTEAIARCWTVSTRCSSSVHIDGARLSVKIKKIRKEEGRQGARGWFLRRVRFIITKTGPRLHRLNVARFACTHSHAHANTDGCPSSLSLSSFSRLFSPPISSPLSILVNNDKSTYRVNPTRRCEHRDIVPARNLNDNSFAIFHPAIYERRSVVPPRLY